MTQNGPAPNGVTCLVTIHGIGFQQAPIDAQGIGGYADGLHQRLHERLPDLLSDDPHRTAPAPRAPGERGPIYVQSSWPPDATVEGVRSVEAGLRRLGHRPTPRSTDLDLTGAPLVQDAERPIAHVALVYTPSEATGPDVGSILETTAQGVVSFEHYTTLWNALKQASADVGAIVHPPAGVAAPTTGNVPRQDAVHHRSAVRALLDRVHPSPPPSQAGALEVLRTVEDDVAGYVARNILRERVRDFLREALVRLWQRRDVAHIVINSHSQGTVLAFDTLRTLPYETIDLIAAYFTLGSPLRKYVEALNWGRDTGRITDVVSWTNVWDRLDPVADPLVPAPPWRRGDADPERAPAGLFLDVDPETGEVSPHPIEDVVVDNVRHVGGSGLRAHDYWGNIDEVVPRLADRLRAVAADAPRT
jgi:hypothetical protein